MTLQNNGKRRPEGAAGSTASTPERVVAREKEDATRGMAYPSFELDAPFATAKWLSGNG